MAFDDIPENFEPSPEETPEERAHRAHRLGTEFGKFLATMELFDGIRPGDFNAFLRLVRYSPDSVMADWSHGAQELGLRRDGLSEADLKIALAMIGQEDRRRIDGIATLH